MSVSPADLIAAEAALRRLQQAAEVARQAADATGDLFASAWSAVMGTESTAAALREDARQTIKALPVMTAKLAALKADPATTHAEVLAFVESVGVFAGVRELLKASELLDPGHAIATIARDSARDAAAAAQGVGESWLSALTWAPVVILFAVGIALYSRVRA